MIKLTGYHYRSRDDNAFEKERGQKQKKLVEDKEDFIDDGIFFVSLNGFDFFPEHLKEKGDFSVIEFNANKVHFAQDYMGYFGAFDYAPGEYSFCKLTNEGKMLADQGYDLIVRADRDDELSEAFIINPKQQVTKITNHEKMPVVETYSLSIPETIEKIKEMLNTTNADHTQLVSTTSGSFYRRPSPYANVDYYVEYPDELGLRAQLLAIKEQKERSIHNVITDVIEGRIQSQYGAMATSHFIFNKERFVEIEDIVKIRKILLDKFSFKQDFVVNQPLVQKKKGKNNHDDHMPMANSPLTYHELLVQYDEKGIPCAAIMFLSTQDLASCYSIEISYVGDIHKGILIKEGLAGLVHRRKYLPTVSTARNIRQTYDGDEYVTFRDDVLSPDVEVSFKSFYPWMKESVGDFARRYMASNAPVLFLYGPTGTGKTTFSRTMAMELNAVIMTTSDIRIATSSGLFDTYREYLKLAKMDEDPRPHILLIEDVDTLLMSRLKNNIEMSRLLNETKGLSFNKDIRVIFSSNLTDLKDVDSALLRPGRCFDKVYFPKLTKAEGMAVREEMQLGEIDLSGSVDSNGLISLGEILEEPVQLMGNENNPPIFPSSSKRDLMSPDF